MGFSFPLFLLAGLAIAIPVVIHLVNLRKYKHEFFPNVRFLENLKISSKRSAEVNKFWLLLSRILFILALVLAFAHPFLKANGGTEQKNDYSVIFIDNSYSMSLKKDGQPLLANAKNKAIKLIDEAPVGSRFVILSNDKIYSYNPIDKTLAREEVNLIELTHNSINLNDLKNAINNNPTSITGRNTTVYIFSDFQKSTLVQEIQNHQNSSIDQDYYLYPVQTKNPENLYIDSIFIDHTTVQSAGDLNIHLYIGRQQSKADYSSNIKLITDNQTRLVKPINFEKNQEKIEIEIPVSSNQKGLVKAEFVLDDQNLDFDDTFRFAAYIPGGHKALIISGDGKTNPYLHTAFNNMPNVSQKTISTNQINTENTKDYSLIIVQSANNCNSELGTILKNALNTGTNVLMFPGESLSNNNACLEMIAGIQFGQQDTSAKQVVTLQKEHPLLSGIFETIPENIQLPVAHKHYFLNADLNANQQDIMSFQDGTPLLSNFNFATGKLYIVTAALNTQSSNFPLSPFFAPFLYKMTIPSGSVLAYYTYIGSREAINILSNSSGIEQESWHLIGKNTDFIPPQKVAGRGLAVYLGKTITEPGFYQLTTKTSDTNVLSVGINTNPKESILNYATKAEIETALSPGKVFWLDDKMIKSKGWQNAQQPYPLWKIAIWLALTSLIIETFLVLQPKVSPAKNK